MQDLPKNRNEAREVGSKAYFTGLFCKQGHLSKRWTATGNCAECQKKRTVNWAKLNPEKIKAIVSTYKKSGKAKEYGKKHYQKNREYYLEKWHKRRAAKLQATTKWGQDGILAFYKKAKELEKEHLNVKYEVDHIIPLSGKNVCGLHNEFNLQILTRSENRKKANKWD